MKIEKVSKCLLWNPPIQSQRILKPKPTKSKKKKFNKIKKFFIEKVLKQKLRNPPIPKSKGTEADTYKIEGEINTLAKSRKNYFYFFLLKNGSKQKLRNPPIPKPKNWSETYKIEEKYINKIKKTLIKKLLKKILKRSLRNPPIQSPRDIEAKTYKIKEKKNNFKKKMVRSVRFEKNRESY